MINAGKDEIIMGNWWTSVFPGVAMSLTVFGFAVLGEAVQSVVLEASMPLCWRSATWG